MTDIEVTPDVIRAVADWLDGRMVPINAGALRDIADKIDRQQADERRIDELAAAFFRAAYPSADPWRDQGDIITDQYHAGIRAVLAKLDEEREQRFDKGGPIVHPLRQWEDLRDVPNDVQAVFTFEGEAHRDESAHNGWRWINRESVSVYGLTAHAPYTEISSVEEPNA